MRLLCLALINLTLALVAAVQSAVDAQPLESQLYDIVPDSAPLDIGGAVSRERLPEN